MASRKFSLLPKCQGRCCASEREGGRKAAGERFAARGRTYDVHTEEERGEVEKCPHFADV